MNMKRTGLVLLSVLLLFAASPAWAQNPHCQQVGGVLMTNIGAIEGVTNLGPVFGDLKGSVAATIVGGSPTAGYDIQHYWVTASGDTIKFDKAHLTPTYPIPADQNIVAVPWGYYGSDITGGTGKFQGATGHLDYFGLADFNVTDPDTNQRGLTLVLRYRGQVCYSSTNANTSKK